MTSRPDPKFGQSKFKMKSLTKWNFCWKFWFSPFNLCCCWVKTTKKEAWNTKELNHFNASQITRKKISFPTNFVMKTETIGHIKWIVASTETHNLQENFSKDRRHVRLLADKPGGYRRVEVGHSLYNKPLRVFALPKVWYWNLKWIVLLMVRIELER